MIPILALSACFVQYELRETFVFVRPRNEFEAIVLVDEFLAQTQVSGTLPAS